MISINLDASAAKLSGCIRKLKLIAVDGYRGEYSLNDIEFGSAMHIFRETLKRTGDKFTAFSEGQNYFNAAKYKVRKGKEFLDVLKLNETMLGYVNHFGEKHEKDNFESFLYNDSPLVEQTFKFPLYQDETGIVYGTGTIDDFGKLKNGCVGILDLKTTTAWDKKEYFKQYELSTQLAFYTLAIKWHAKHYPDSFFGQFKNQRIGAFIDVIFLKKDYLAEFERQFYPPNDLLLEEFECALVAVAKRLLENAVVPLPIRDGVLTGSCEPKFKEPCPFFGVCASPDEVAARAILRNYFIQKPYNPLEFRKVS